MTTRADRGWLLAGYAGIVGFFVLEALVRQPGTAASLNASRDDRGTTRTMLITFAIAAGLPLAFRRMTVPRLPAPVGPAGLVLQAGGLTLRTWSMRTLGGSYTRTLRTDGDQHVVDSGPYRLIRHPGYTGSLLTWVGFALTTRNLSVITLVSALLGRAYRRRITAEEQLLQRDLLGYATYRNRTKRLVPFVW